MLWKAAVNAHDVTLLHAVHLEKNKCREFFCAGNDSDIGNTNTTVVTDSLQMGI